MVYILCVTGVYVFHRNFVFANFKSFFGLKL